MIPALAVRRVRADRVSMNSAFEEWQQRHATLDDSIAAALPDGYGADDVTEIADLLGWTEPGVENARTRSVCRAAGHPELCTACLLQPTHDDDLNPL